jgi:hypothetical protein
VSAVIHTYIHSHLQMHAFFRLFVYSHSPFRIPHYYDLACYWHCLCWSQLICVRDLVMFDCPSTCLTKLELLKCLMQTFVRRELSRGKFVAFGVRSKKTVIDQRLQWSPFDSMFWVNPQDQVESIFVCSGLSCQLQFVGAHSR